MTAVHRNIANGSRPVGHLDDIADLDEGMYKACAAALRLERDRLRTGLSGQDQVTSRG